MYFSSFTELFSMAGHGPYVWAAYAITFVVLSLLVISPLKNQAQAKQDIRMRIRRENRSKNKPLHRSS